MPTYVYDTVPQSEQDEPAQFEIHQRMSEEALTKHPETGQPVRRIISGGIHYRSRPRRAAAVLRSARVDDSTMTAEI